MHGTAKYEVLPEMKYSDILVPTIDTVRSAHIIGMLLDIKKPVSASSPWVSARRPGVSDAGECPEPVSV